MQNLIDRVYGYSLQNPYGFTLNIETFRPITFGFSVAYLETQDSFGKESLEKVINHALLNHKIVGGWLNDKNKMYYFDSIAIFEKLEDAVVFAKENKQLAIFDLTNLKEIPIGS